MLLSVRELLVRQRTQLINAMRGHAAEMGVVAPLGEKGLAELKAEISQRGDRAARPRSRPHHDPAAGDRRHVDAAA
jgi:transposase